MQAPLLIAGSWEKSQESDMKDSEHETSLRLNALCNLLTERFIVGRLCEARYGVITPLSQAKQETHVVGIISLNHTV